MKPLKDFTSALRLSSRQMGEKQVEESSGRKRDVQQNDEMIKKK